MGRLDNLPDNTGSGDSTAAEILRTVAQDLRSLQQGLVAQLTQDVDRLQAEKSRLLDEIAKLEAQQRSLQTQNQTALSRQQIAQQQLWAKQLAQALAKQLHLLLSERIQATDLAQPEPASLLPSAAEGYGDNATRMLASLDTTINHTLSSVRQDLNSYQSSLSQQLSRMHNLEQQGEAILEALVSRLNQQLQAEATRMQPENAAAPNSSYAPAAPFPSQPIHPNPLRPAAVLPVSPVIAPEPTVAPVRSFFRPGLSQFQTGLALILLSTVALSLHNIVVGIIGYTSRILGIYEMGGLINLTLGNSLLILWMRMLVVIPLMMTFASFLYPSAWKDIQVFLQFKDRRLLRSVVGSGFFLFLSQVLIYIAFGQFGNPGVPVTILFMYPIVTVPLAWALFGDRPTLLRIIVMVAILSGVVLTAFPKLASTTDISWLGVGTATISGIAFAFYLISMQISFRKLHPVPVSLIQFVTIFVLTSICLIIRPFNLIVDVPPQSRLGLILGGLILGTLTLAGYLLNNFGVRFMGAARASIIAASGPVLTALLAFLIIPGPRTTLQNVQWLGILIVTIGVIALSFERMLMQNKAAKSAG